MKKVLVFGASNSHKSINKALATYAGSLLDAKITLIDLNDFEMPLYSIDREHKEGIPHKAHDFNNLIKQSDGVVISFAEHNGAYTVAYKNVTDWASRIEKSLWKDKPMALLATSPGARGGSGVLGIAKTSIGFANKNLVGTFSLPSFNQNFEQNRVSNEEFNEQLKSLMSKLEDQL